MAKITQPPKIVPYIWYQRTQTTNTEINKWSKRTKDGKITQPPQRWCLKFDEPSTNKSTQSLYCHATRRSPLKTHFGSCESNSFPCMLPYANPAKGISHKAKGKRKHSLVALVDVFFTRKQTRYFFCILLPRPRPPPKYDHNSYNFILTMQALTHCTSK